MPEVPYFIASVLELNVWHSLFVTRLIQISPSGDTDSLETRQALPIDLYQ